MIFVTVGSRRFPFDRLIRAVDAMAFELGLSKDEVFAQIGTSSYKPVGINYQEYLDRPAYEDNINRCDILVTHAAAGSVISGLHSRKRIIAVPRLQKFGEIIDNHQTELAAALAAEGCLIYLEDPEGLTAAVREVLDRTFKPYECDGRKTIDLIRRSLGN